MFERRLRLAMWSGVINSAFLEPVQRGTVQKKIGQQSAHTGVRKRFPCLSILIFSLAPGWQERYVRSFRPWIL